MKKYIVFCALLSAAFGYTEPPFFRLPTWSQSLQIGIGGWLAWRGITVLKKAYDHYCLKNDIEKIVESLKQSVIAQDTHIDNLKKNKQFIKLLQQKYFVKNDLKEIVKNQDIKINDIKKYQKVLKTKVRQTSSYIKKCGEDVQKEFISSCAYFVLALSRLSILFRSSVTEDFLQDMLSELNIALAVQQAHSASIESIGQILGFL